MKKCKPKAYIRPDDEEVFSLNKDGKTYSLEFMKKRWADALTNKYTERIMKLHGFIPMYT